MPRVMTKTERMTEDLAQAILRHCYGSISGFWRRHLVESGVTLPALSAALKRDPVSPEVISKIIAAAQAAFEERPLEPFF